jgi:hypothetical protein
MDGVTSATSLACSSDRRPAAAASNAHDTSRSVALMVPRKGPAIPAAILVVMQAVKAGQATPRSITAQPMSDLHDMAGGIDGESMRKAAGGSKCQEDQAAHHDDSECPAQPPALKGTRVM